MTGRWDQSDLNIYGAEDDDEMDAIMKALDDASRDDDPAAD
jgi:hypothetical protein